MRNEEYKALKPWTCPACSRQFQFSVASGNVLTWSALAVGLIVLYCLGFRGASLFAMAVILWFPVLLLLIGIFDPLFPPRLEAYRSKKSRKEESIQTLLGRSEGSEDTSLQSKIRGKDEA